MYPQSYACYQNKKGRHCNKGVKGKRHGQLPKEGFTTTDVLRRGWFPSKGGDGGCRRYWVNQQMCSRNPEVKQKAGIDCALMLALVLWLNEATHC